ncbi:relaxase/mobilization nuclease domain-containing protein [Halomonas sp. AOP27-A1-41]|uniref:relaxase/mobilization nuclease domain-containing protein n=1 Tax=Halomonas sp. AOP27-A1-41 TaxID=3457707 RepID=UPI00403347DE
MIGKVCDSRRDGKSSFRTLKEYLVDQLRSQDWGAGDQEVLEQDGTVFAHTASGVTLEHNGFDLDTLVQEFESVAAMKPKVEDPVYHFVLSWSENDNPSDKEMLGSAREAMKRLGFEGHQYLSAIHRDTDSPHVHVAVNRIHPDSFKVVNPYRDHYTLRTLANELEKRYGWVATRQSGKPEALPADAHGDLSFEQWCKSKVVPLMAPLVEKSASWADVHKSLNALDVELIEYGKGLVFRTVSDTGTAVAVKASAVHEGFSKPSLERALGTFEAALKAPKAQSYPGEPQAFAVAVKGVLNERIARWAGRTRSDWTSLHRLMGENGLQLTPYGQGLAISPADGHGPRMAASKLHRSLAKGKLEARLGPYQPPEVVPGSAYARDRQESLRRAPTDASALLRERYAAYRAEMPTYGKLRQHISRSIREIRRETRQEIKEVYDSMPPSAVRAAYLQELRWQQTRQILGERLRLIQQYNAKHEHAALGWRQWIEEQARLGDANAIEMAASWHTNRHHPQARSHANSVAPAQPGSAFIELTPGIEALLGWERRHRRNGRIDFYSQRGELMVTQLRNSVKSHRLDNVTVAATMQLAIDAYGYELRLTGSDEFKQRAIEALVKLENQGGPRVRLSDQDLQQRLEEQRAAEVAQRRTSRRMR